MKKMILAMFALAFIAVNLNAQVLQPIQYKTLRFYNEAGTLVTAPTQSSATAAGVGSTGAVGGGDTLVSEAIMLDFDDLKWGIACGNGDTMYCNVSYQLGAGVVTGAGFYARGAIAAVTKVDSVISLGTRTMIVGQTGKLQLTANTMNASKGHTSTVSTYGTGATISGRDSTWTNTFASSADVGGYQWVRIVLIFHNINDVSNTTILNQNLAVIRRYN